jgi:hypothetical protein
MKNEFVPYNIARDLKKIGFDEDCLAYYMKGSHNTSCKAPLYQQAFRWFREELGIDVCIIPKFGDNGYGAECFKNGSLLPIELLGNEYAYEEAQAECLRQITDFVNQ